MTDIMDPTIEQMRSRLLTVEQARERLGRTEPISEVSFEAQKGVQFRVEKEWDEVADATEGTDLVPAFVRFFPNGADFRLTKDALMEFGAKVGIPRKLQERTPAHLLEPQLNWWFEGNGGWEGKKFKSFVSGSQVNAMGSGTIQPFSNL